MGVQYAISREDLLGALNLGARQTVKRENRCREVSEFFQRRTCIGLLLPQLGLQQTYFPATVKGPTFVITGTRFEPGDVAFQSGYYVHGEVGVPEGLEPSGTFGRELLLSFLF